MVARVTLLILFVSLYPFLGLNAQKRMEASGILFQYEVKNDSIHAALTAPTKGWVGVGFNTKNSIVGSDLLLFNVRGGQVNGTDLFVKSAGNPFKDSDLGGENTIAIHSGIEQKGYTKIAFSIPLDSGDPNDFVHVLGKKSWLILAYSVSDDFEHHSRVRKHVPFVLQK